MAFDNRYLSNSNFCVPCFGWETLWKVLSLSCSTLTRCGIFRSFLEWKKRLRPTSSSKTSFRCLLRSARLVQRAVSFTRIRVANPACFFRSRHCCVNSGLEDHGTQQDLRKILQCLGSLGSRCSANYCSTGYRYARSPACLFLTYRFRSDLTQIGNR